MRQTCLMRCIDAGNMWFAARRGLTIGKAQSEQSSLYILSENTRLMKSSVANCGRFLAGAKCSHCSSFGLASRNAARIRFSTHHTCFSIVPSSTQRLRSLDARCSETISLVGVAAQEALMIVGSSHRHRGFVDTRFQHSRKFS